jgi:hypothetical protein
MSDTMPNYDIDETSLASAVENAPEAGFVNVNFGRLTATAQIISWGAKDPATNKSQKLVRPLKPGDSAKEGETTELKFSVNIAEFNPVLTFAYERTVPIKVSSARAKTDWTEIVQPSLIAVFGSNWIKIIKQQPYVAVEDAVNFNGNTSAKTGKAYGVPKFLATFANSAECKAARDARYSSGHSNADAELTAVVEQVKGLISAVGNVDDVRPLLSAEPYNKYDADQLLALALI